VERTAFARAWGYLNYKAGAKWGALACAAGASLLFVALLGVMALFVHLLVERGDVPSYGQLSPDRREAFRANWLARPRDERQLGLQHARGVTDHTRLLADNPDALTSSDWAVAWRAQVWLLLNERVGREAADRYEATEPIDEVSRAEHGVLSLVVRARRNWVGRSLGWMASWNRWAWQPKLGSTPDTSYLTGLLILAVALALSRAVLISVNNALAAQATLEAMSRLRRAIYHHTYRLGTLAITALGPSEAVSMFTRHVEAVHDALVAWLTVVAREPIKFMLVLMFALLIDFWLGLAFILLAVLLWVVGSQVISHYRRQARVAIRRGSHQLALLQESLKLMRLVKVYLMELFNQARVERQLADYSEAHVERYWAEASAKSLLAVLGTLAAVALCYVAGLVLLRDGISVARLIVLAATLFSLYFPLQAYLNQRRVLRRGRDSAAVLFEFLDRRGEVAQVVGAEFLQPLSKQLEFNEVSLREPGTGRMLLQGVSMTIPAYTRVALVGPDHAETHALVYMIPRFLDPTSGEIRIDGQNVRWVTLDSLRAQIAMVLQHNLVFNDTVANNIGCGDASYTIPQIIEAAKVTHAHHFIQKLPYGYETRIGEMGQTLRVGEQFRIALARAILRDPALLIIEEPDGPLDDETKELLDDTFDRILTGRTAIFLPHRISTVRSCDRIYLINKGRVEAAGEHRELLTTNDFYKHLHYLEFNPFAEQMG
jgi:ABC-type multidrug transport system fused ATPase/permease subunit